MTYYFNGSYQLLSFFSKLFLGLGYIGCGMMQDISKSFPRIPIMLYKI